MQCRQCPLYRYPSAQPRAMQHSYQIGPPKALTRDQTPLYKHCWMCMLMGSTAAYVYKIGLPSLARLLQSPACLLHRVPHPGVCLLTARPLTLLRSARRLAAGRCGGRSPAREGARRCSCSCAGHAACRDGHTRRWGSRLPPATHRAALLAASDLQNHRLTVCSAVRGGEERRGQ